MDASRRLERFVFFVYVTAKGYFAYRSSWLLPRPPPGEGFALPAPCGGP